MPWYGTADLILGGELVMQGRRITDADIRKMLGKLSRLFPKSSKDKTVVRNFIVRRDSEHEVYIAMTICLSPREDQAE